MEFYIGIEDLAANALIALLKKDVARRFVSYKDIEAYGNKVVSVLKERKEKAVLILSRESTNAFFHNYSEFFVESFENDLMGIRLKADKEVDDLIDQFCGYVAFDVLVALSDNICLQEISGVA